MQINNPTKDKKAEEVEDEDEPTDKCEDGMRLEVYEYTVFEETWWIQGVPRGRLRSAWNDRDCEPQTIPSTLSLVDIVCVCEKEECDFRL